MVASFVFTSAPTARGGHHLHHHATGRRREELALISGALTLLTNAVVAYNTWKLNEVVEGRRKAGRAIPPDDILAHVAPIAFGHINFRGVYRFPLERYVDRLVPSAPAAKIAIGVR